MLSADGIRAAHRARHHPRRRPVDLALPRYVDVPLDAAGLDVGLLGNILLFGTCASSFFAALERGVAKIV